MSHWEMPNHLKPKEKRKKTVESKAIRLTFRSRSTESRQVMMKETEYSCAFFFRVFIPAKCEFCAYLACICFCECRFKKILRVSNIAKNEQNSRYVHVKISTLKHRIFLSFILVLIFQSRFSLFFFLFLSINSWFRGNTLGNTFGEIPFPVGFQYSSQFFPMKIRRRHWYGPVELRKDWWGLNIIILIHLARESLILLWRSTLETNDEYQMDILSLLSISSACTVIHNQASLLRSISRPEVFCKKCVLRNFDCKIHWNKPVPEPFSVKVAGLNLQLFK